MQAWRLKHLGWKQRQIAVALDVTEGAVSRWVATARCECPAALRARPHLGPAAKLEPDQLRLIPDFLSHGAEAYDFRGEVWTCSRVAKVIEEEFGVSYHKGHVARLLKELRGTPQLPIARAIQRDEQEIEQWRVAVWPRLKDEAHRERRALVFVDESGFYLLPGKVRTYAPEGHTPVLHEWQTRDHLSVMGGVTPTGKIYTLMRQESLNGLHTIEFLKHLIRHIGPRLWVIWDGSPIHRRKEVKQFLASAIGHGVRVERLPPYAPDLNPVEGAWQHLKHVEMRNLVCLDLEELHLELHLAVGRLRQKPRLIRSFFVEARLEAENFTFLRNAQ
ncbi:MAG: IS630 family transposase [Planctomycetaceae bacterium]|nr:IS630 family transposase [Planctomycetaceae bacterium]